MCASVLFCFQTSYNPDLLEDADSIRGQMCGDKAAPSVAYPVMAEFGRRMVESKALSVAHCIFVVVLQTDSQGRELDGIAPEMIFFTVVKGEKWMWSHQRAFFHRETDEGEKWMGSHHRRFFSQRDS